jgi:lauroyl/myristoyl acyltransferase
MRLIETLRRWLKAIHWRYGSQVLDYDLFLPLIARLPLPWAYRLSSWRGAFNARNSRDWAELAVGFPYIGERCAAAFRYLRPQASEEEIRRLVTQRYQMVARYELDGALAAANRLAQFQIDLTPVKAALAQRTPGRGTVMLVCHHESFFVGMLALARCGVPVYLMTSDVVFDPRVHPAFRRFTRTWYASFQKHTNAVFCPASSKGRETFYGALARGAVVVVASDTPTARSSDKGTWVSWLGKRRKLADSAVRMAIETDSEMMAMQIRQVAPGQFVWSASEVVDTRKFTHLPPALAREQVCAPLFAFLEQGVAAEPGLWWASHLLGEFENQDEAVN